MGSEATENAQANGDTRSLTLYHTHRGDTTTITFKRDGRYDAEGLKQLNYFLRDWRNDKQTRMEPRLFDIVWEVHRQVGRGGMINIVSSYRSPETNAYLRSHSQGVAKFSQHMLGRAMDFYITGVPVSAVREAGMRLQRGGVGFYPTSGRPFVHLDAGNVRAWPRMTRTQLVKLFPDGKTVHVPADGKPLPGYQVAMAELKARGSVSVEDAYASRSTGKGFFARLFGGGDEGDDAETVVASAAPARAAASSAPSRGGDDEESTAAIPATRVATIRVPVPVARPSDMIRNAPAETAVAAASIPLPPVGPARAAVEAPVQVAAANVPLPPVAPAVVAAKPVPLPPSAPAYEVASIQTPPAADAGPDMVWQAGAQPVGQNPASAGLAAASNVPTPRPRPTESAVAVLAALPAPSSAEGSSSRPRKIDPQVASAYQAEAGTFPRLPDAFTSKKSASAGEMRMAYADPQIELPSTAPASTRPAVAPQTRVSSTAPTDPNVRVLSPYATPAAVYAAAAAPQKRRATLSAPEGMVTARMDTTTLRAAASPVPAAHQAVMVHPDQLHVASLMVAPNAALVGGFNGDPTHGARTDRFSGSSVMLLRTQSFMPGVAYASASSHG